MGVVVAAPVCRGCRHGFGEHIPGYGCTHEETQDLTCVCLGFEDAS